MEPLEYNDAEIEETKKLAGYKQKKSNAMQN